MNNKSLCISLLKADSESDVIKILKKAGYWEKESAWRLYGDRDGNFATIGNQQSRPDAALVEKIINSVDARLMNACLEKEISPEGKEAPKSIREAISLFFEEQQHGGEVGGKIQKWSSEKRKEQAHFITLAATGGKKNKMACLTLVDQGEGQSPDRMPDTFLSIEKENKLKIPFVQGKFNMGGTGVLKFCGTDRLELIISRRNPKLVASSSERDSEWSFTVVRRERPKKGAGAVRNSRFTYLAPIDCDQNPRRGGLLSFPSDTLPLMPNDNQPYVRKIGWGSAIKLYNYDMKGFPSNVLMKDGLLYRLSVLLPEIALPVRVHECRKYSGKKGSYETTMEGLIVRLEEGKGDNLESDYPSTVPFSVRGEQMKARIYAFKKGKAETYRTNEGVIFAINGQTHGYVPKTIFSRKSVKMGRLADSLLVIVDCSNISVDAREDLFMNSRDRLSDGELRKEIEKELEQILHKHPGLRELREQRRTAEIEDRLRDNKPLEEVLEAVLKSSPSLAQLFLHGRRLSRPSGNGKKSGGKNGNGANSKGEKFKGKQHPSFFRFYKKKDGEALERNCEIKRRCRLTLETDVVNTYFDRNELPGNYSVEATCNGEILDVTSSLTLHNGMAHWSIDVPDSCVIGDELYLICKVSDEVIGDGFTNTAKLKVCPKSTKSGGSTSNRKSLGNGGKGSSDNGLEVSGFQLPDPIRVKEEDWSKHKFDQYSACKVIEDEIGEEGSEERALTFYVNVDNTYLKNDIKNGFSDEDPKLTETKFVYGNVLIGLALLQQAEKQRKKDTDSDEMNSIPIEEHVLNTTRAIGPFIVPMINYLGGLTSEDVLETAEMSDVS